MNHCAHPGQVLRKRYDLRLARRMFDDGGTLGETGGHHQIFRPGDAGVIEVDRGAL